MHNFLCDELSDGAKNVSRTVIFFHGDFMTAKQNFSYNRRNNFLEAIIMTKKLFAAMILAFALVVAGQTSTAQAEEVYVGSYSDGTSVYLLTETVNISSYRPYRFTCTVRTGSDYLEYSFYPSNGSPYYRNSEGYEGYVNGGASPVASNIYRYVINNF